MQHHRKRTIIPPNHGRLTSFVEESVYFLGSTKVTRFWPTAISFFILPPTFLLYPSVLHCPIAWTNLPSSASPLLGSTSCQRVASLKRLSRLQGTLDSCHKGRRFHEQSAVSFSVFGIVLVPKQVSRAAPDERHLFRMVRCSTCLLRWDFPGKSQAFQAF